MLVTKLFICSATVIWASFFFIIITSQISQVSHYWIRLFWSLIFLVLDSLILQQLINCVGLEKSGNCKLRPANFTIDTFAAGQGKPAVTVVNPQGKQEKVSRIREVATA